MNDRLLFHIGSIQFFSSSAKVSHLNLPATATFPAHLYIQQGVVTIKSGNQLIPADAGTVYFIPENTTVELLSIHQKSWRAMLLPFSGPLCEEYTRHLSSSHGPTVQVSRSATLVQVGRRIAQAKTEDERSLAIFDWFLEIDASNQKARNALQSLLNGTLEEVLALCRRYTLSVNALSMALGCSPVFLSYRLKQAWGISAGRFLKKLRYFYAAQLLETTDLPLEVIAFQCGFSGVASFTIAIQKIARKTPAQIRQQKKRVYEKIARELQASRKTVSAAPPVVPSSHAHFRHDDVPIVVRDGPFFHFDGGIGDFEYKTPFELSINAITTKVVWVYTLSGEAIFEVGDYRLHVRPGMAVLHPGPLNGRWITPRGNWKRIWILARGQWAMQTLRHFADLHGWFVRVDPTSEPIVLARKWGDHWNAHRSFPTLRESRMAYQWILSWKRLFDSGKMKPVDNPDLQRALSRPFFRRIKTIKQYAKELGYSRPYLSAKLKRQWQGGTPAQIIRRQRLAQAAHEIRTTSLPIGEIARRANYAHTSTFIAAFQREFRTSPLHYRFHATDANADAQPKR